MRQELSTLRAAITVVTRILSERNIPVVQRGLEARVSYDEQGQPVEIQIPYLPDDAPDSLIRAIHGFIDHEVGHVLDTDAPLAYGYIKRWKQEYGRKAHVVIALQNILEDVYIERCQERRFRGCGYNLSQVREFLLETLIEPKRQQMDDEKEISELLTFAVLRAWGGQSAFRSYMEDKWGQVSFLVDRIPQNLREQVANVNSTQDACELAEALFKALMEPPQEQPESSSSSDSESDQPENEDESQSQSQETEPSGEDDMESPSEPNESTDGDDQDSESSSEDEEQPEGDAESDDGGSGASESDSSDDNTDQESNSSPGDSSGDESNDSEVPDQEGESDQGEGDIEPSDTEQAGESGRGNTDTERSGPLEDFEPAEFDELAKEAIAQASVQSAEHAEYLPFTEEEDVTEVWNPSGRQLRALPDMMDRVEHLIGPMTHSLERAIKTKALARWTAGHRRGRFDARQASRLAISKRHPELHTDRICKQREMSVTNDVAVSILVDCSGSMGGDDIQIAMDITYGIASTLERLNIACEVTGFTTRGMKWSNHIDLEEEERKRGIQFSRTEGLYMPIFKGFHERMNARVSDRFACYPIEPGEMRHTIIGEPVQQAFDRLNRRSEKGRLMIVITDGQPAAYTNHDLGNALFMNHAKRIIQGIEQGKRANILGIGIGIDVSQLFSRAMRVDQIADLPSVIVRELKGYVVDHAHN